MSFREQFGNLMTGAYKGDAPSFGDLMTGAYKGDAPWGTRGKGFGGLTPHPDVMTPNIRKKIEDFLGQMGDSTGAFPWKDFDEYLGRPGSRPEDRILHKEQWGNIPGPSTTMMGRHPDGTPITFDNPNYDTQGPATPPLDKTLEQRVWERDQINRVPDDFGRLYPDKNDPNFLDPRIGPGGAMTMQYIPEIDNPNWTPWNQMPQQPWNIEGEGIQYRN